MYLSARELIVAARPAFLAGDSVQDEIIDIAAKIQKYGLSLLVIDSENKFISTGFAKEIARVANGEPKPHAPDLSAADCASPCSLCFSLFPVCGSCMQEGPLMLCP